MVSGAFERNVIETIIEKTEEYFNNEEKNKNKKDGKDEENDKNEKDGKVEENDKNEKDGKVEENDKNGKDGKVEEKGDKNQQQNLEAKIVDTTEKLLEMTKLFSAIRTGTDEVSKATPTKLRQQIYGALGHR